MPFYYGIRIDGYECGFTNIFRSRKKLSIRKFLRRLQQAATKSLEYALENEIDFFWECSGNGITFKDLYNSKFIEELERLGLELADSEGCDEFGNASYSKLPEPRFTFCAFDYSSICQKTYYDKYIGTDFRLLRSSIPQELKKKAIEISKEYQKDLEGRLKLAITKKYGPV